MTPPTPSPWTDERVATLTRMWSDGFSAPAIAARLGGGITNHSVIGKANRLGLGEHPNARNRLGQLPRKPYRKRVQRQKPAATAYETLEAIPAAPEPPVAVQEASTTTLLDVRANQCHWPIGEPKGYDTEYCGAPKSLGTPYCGYHARIAYQPRKRECAA